MTRPPETNDVDACDSNISTETSELVFEPVVNESHVEVQPKVWSDAPIIEEYESDSEMMYENGSIGNNQMQNSHNKMEFAEEKEQDPIDAAEPCLQIHIYLTRFWEIATTWCKFAGKSDIGFGWDSLKARHLIRIKNARQRPKRTQKEQMTIRSRGGELIRRGGSLRSQADREDKRERFKHYTKASGTTLLNTDSITIMYCHCKWDYLSLTQPIPQEDDYEIPPLEDIHEDATDGDTDITVQTRSKVNKSSEAHAFVSYVQKQRRTNHKDFHHCLFACFLSQHEPKKISEALEDESWVDAMQEELLQFEIQKGHRQEEGIDYDEVFAPVARLEAIRIFLAYASYMGFIVYQMDVKSAFLYGKIDEEFFQGHISKDISFTAFKRIFRKSTTGRLTNYLAETHLHGNAKSTNHCLLPTTEADMLAAAKLLWANPYGIPNQMLDYASILSTDLLLFDDSNGIDTLPNQAIFDAIQLMGYEGDLTVLTFNKALFSPQWRQSETHPTTPLCPEPTSEAPNESMNDSSSAQSSEVSDQAKEIKLLKAKITKLKRKANPVIKHFKEYQKRISKEQRHQRKHLSKKKKVQIKSVSKQGRKNAKGDGKAKENAQSEGRTKEM
ncbi:putative ribonuclease H-like domain-containing protein [Tanacetum coccineum]